MPSAGTLRYGLVVPDLQHRPRMAVNDDRGSHGNGQAPSTGRRNIHSSEIHRDLPCRSAQNSPRTAVRCACGLPPQTPRLVGLSPGAAIWILLLGKLDRSTARSRRGSRVLALSCGFPPNLIEPALIGDYLRGSCGYLCGPSPSGNTVNAWYASTRMPAEIHFFILCCPRVP
jgi:hypothetical protein